MEQAQDHTFFFLLFIIICLAFILISIDISSLPMILDLLNNSKLLKNKHTEKQPNKNIASPGVAPKAAELG